MPQYNQALQQPIFKVLSQIIADNHLNAYVIGGFVRDFFLNRQSKDIDIVVCGSGIELAQKLSKSFKKPLPLTVYKTFGTAMVRFNDVVIEFVGARKESYNRNSRKPVVENGTLRDDQLRRDFTINALALSLRPDNFGELIDPFGGLSDLHDKRIITPLEPVQTFSDDPLRMLRAVRFATQLNFGIATHVQKAIKQSAHRLNIISAERIADELNKIMLTAKPSVGFLVLEETGLLPYILPELQAMKGVEVVEGKKHKDNFYHSLQVLDNICLNTTDLWLRWAALLHDVGKPRTKRLTPEGWTFHGHEYVGSKMIPKIFARLKLPLNEKMKYVEKLVALHLRPIPLVQDHVTDSALRRLLYDAGDDVEDLMTLCEADITSKNEARVKQYLNNFKIVRQKLVEVEQRDAIRNFQPPVSGELIMKTFDLQPSKLVGEIKNAIKEAILEGEIHNQPTEAYHYMLKIAAQKGLQPV